MKTITLATIIAALSTSAALAQDPERDPTFGSVMLAAGFDPDPQEIRVQAGGPVDANASIGEACIGAIPRAPVLNLNYEAGEDWLVIAARAGTDTTMAIQAPDGSWLCDDDRAGDLNPLITFETPQSGVYHIFLGTYDPDAGTTPAALILSSSEPPPRPVWSLPAGFGTIELGAGFGSREIEVTAGGPVDASSTMPADCEGFIPQAPSYELYFEAGDGALVFDVVPETDGVDAMLVVNAPDAEWFCNVDDGEAPEPRIVFDAPLTGVYDVWVGVESAEAIGADAVLTVSEPAAD